MFDHPDGHNLKYASVGANQFSLNAVDLTVCVGLVQSRLQRKDLPAQVTFKFLPVI